MLEVLNIDLHLHSYASDKYKENDWKGETEKKYIDQLSSYTEKLDVFAITDHNTMDFDLFEEISKNENLGKKFFPGIEIDVLDVKIKENCKFHMLLIFDNVDIDKLKSFLKLFREYKGEIDKETTWNFTEIYDALYTSGINSFFAIPHFNNKGTSITVNEVLSMNTPLAIFSSFEDGNNPTKISQSIKKYIENDAKNFSTVAFSDWHGEDDKNSPTFILGNKDYLFESLRLSFSDPRMRISFKDKSGKYVDYTRNFENPIKYIKTFNLNGSEYELSPFQNTIIGGFGSGKSLLSKLMLDGIELTKTDKYREIIGNENKFTMTLNDGTNIDSLSHESVNCVSLQQNNVIYSCSKLDIAIASEIESKLKLEFPQIPKISFSEISINSEVKSLYTVKNTQINYEKISNVQFFQLLSEKININQTNFTLSKFKQYFDQLMSYVNFLSIENEQNPPILLNEKEVKILNSFENSIVKIEENIEKRKNMITYGFNKIDDLILRYNNKVSNLSEGSSSQIEQIENCILELKNFKENLKKLKIKCNGLDDYLKTDNIDELLNREETITHLGDYNFIFKYDVQEYKPIYEQIFLNRYKEKQLFNAIIKMYREGSIDLLKKTEIYEIDDFISNISKKQFSELEKNFSFDIKYEGDSLMKKSAGGRALMILDILLKKMENTNDQICNILIIDQPEDNMDNKSIYEKFVNKIRDIKFSNEKNIQLIFVSHNANIAISADSENIIIANGIMTSGKFEFCYTSGTLENKKFRDEICMILEGGSEALLKRGLKFNVNFNKKELND